MNAVEKPSETWVRDHPNSDSSGAMYSPKAQKDTPLPTDIPATDAARIHQPRNGARRRGEARSVPDGAAPDLKIPPRPVLSV